MSLGREVPTDEHTISTMVLCSLSIRLLHLFQGSLQRQIMTERAGKVVFLISEDWCEMVQESHIEGVR